MTNESSYIKKKLVIVIFLLVSNWMKELEMIYLSKWVMRGEDDRKEKSVEKNLQDQNRTTNQSSLFISNLFFFYPTLSVS